MTKTRRICLAVDLKDDPEAIAAYEHYHRAENSWPEVVARIADSGIAQMEIFRTGNRLFMVMDVTADFDPEANAIADAADPKTVEWQKLMGGYMKTLPWAEPGVKWVEMDCIYRLTDAQADVASRA